MVYSPHDLRRWMTLCEAVQMLDVPDLSGDWYHGTGRNGLDFQENRVAYFTAYEAEATVLAKEDAQVDAGTPHVIRVRLDVHNPAHIDTMEMQDLHFKPDVVAKLQALGHDCAIGDYDGEVAVFGAEHIHVLEIIDVE